jgi:hypothetical protein
VKEVMLKRRILTVDIVGLYMCPLFILSLRGRGYGSLSRTKAASAVEDIVLGDTTRSTLCIAYERSFIV